MSGGAGGIGGESGVMLGEVGTAGAARAVSDGTAAMKSTITRSATYGALAIEAPCSECIFVPPTQKKRLAFNARSQSTPG